MPRRIIAVTLAVLCLTLARPLAPVVAADEEAPESAVSSPPMEMDDPGTPGRQGIEVNFVGTHIRLGEGRNYESLLDANYGIGDRIQLKYERPYLSQGAVGVPAQRGLGATEIGIKWRFVDSRGLAIAVYPQYTFNDAFTIRSENGEPEAGEGRSYYLPVLVSKQFQGVNTLALNVGFRRNLENFGNAVVLAIGAGHAFGEYQRALIEAFSERESDFNNLETDVRVGYVWSMMPHRMEHTHFELPVYVSIGHSVGPTEAAAKSASFVFGVSIIRKPQGE